MRVLVVDDSAFMRRSLTRLIESEPGLSVIDTARDGLEAVEKARLLRPDLITLDIHMPRLDGLGALERIMAESPTAVLMVSSLTTRGSQDTLDALRLGALDFVAKDARHVSLDIHAIRNELVAKIKALGAAKTGERPTSNIEGDAHGALQRDSFELVVVGSSTGGPPVLETIISSLSPQIAAPIVVAQHMPAIFTRSLADRLNGRCIVNVLEAENGMPLYPGAVYIAPGGRHTVVRRIPGQRPFLRVVDEPVETLFKPSVDELFASAADACAERALGIVLTGMGEDGVEGARAIVDAGGAVLTQEASTCVIYGMPKAVDDENLSTARLTPREICAAIGSIRQPEPETARRSA